MSTATDSLHFAYSLAVERLTTPAGAAADAIGRVNKVLAVSQKLLEKLEERLPRVGERLQAFSQTANTGFLRAELAATRFVATTQKIEGVLSRIKEAAGSTGGVFAQMTARAERASRAASATPDSRRRHEVTYQAWWEQQLARREKVELQKTKTLEREAMKRARIAEQEQKAQETAAAKAQKAAEKAAEKAYKQSITGAFLGGHRSFNDLLMEGARQRLQSTGSGLADSITGIPGSLIGGIGGLAVSGITAAAGAAWDLAKAGAEGAFSFAKMAISAQALREQSVASFQAVYGQQSVAEELFSQAVRIAKTTKFDTPEVVQAFNNLAAGGFAANQLENVFNAVADVQSARGSGKARQFERGLISLQMAPTAYWGAFKQAMAGGPGSVALDALAAGKGITGGNKVQQVMALFREGKIGREESIDAILRGVSQRYDQGGKLGTFAKAQGMGTWEGLLSNIRNGLSDVLTMKLAPDHPMNKLKDILKVVNSLFDDANPRAQRFNKVVSAYLGDVFRIFDIGDGNAEKTVDSVLKILEDLQPRFSSFMQYIRDEMIKPLLEAFNKEGAVSEKLRELAFTIGPVVGKALFEGIKQGFAESFTSGEWEANNRKAVWSWFEGKVGLGDYANKAVSDQVAQAAGSSSSTSARGPLAGQIVINQTLPPNAQPADYEQSVYRALEEAQRNPK